MLEEGWADEVRRLRERGLPAASNSCQAIGYREVAEWVLGRMSKQEAEEQIVIATRGLARRQTTWLARERGVSWMEPETAVSGAMALLDEAGDRESQ